MLNRQTSQNVITSGIFNLPQIVMQRYIAAKYVAFNASHTRFGLHPMLDVKRIKRFVRQNGTKITSKRDFTAVLGVWHAN